MQRKLEELDDYLGYLIEQLKENNLFNRLNLIITSDHGMESISQNTTIYLDSYIDTSLFESYGSRACYVLFVKNGLSKNVHYSG
jgi:ectonucleotide pyrophosphatase/phosphodiesterase family protein 5